LIKNTIHRDANSAFMFVLKHAAKRLKTCETLKNYLFFVPQALRNSRLLSISSADFAAMRCNSRCTCSPMLYRPDNTSGQHKPGHKSRGEKSSCFSVVAGMKIPRWRM